MAQVIGPWTRALNSALVLIPSAKLRLYEEGTTTLATVYSDDALTTEHTNPITADGSGYFPQIFATAGLLFDCATLQSDGTTLVKDWGTWEALGSQSGTVEYDFGADGRLVFRAAGGMPNIEFGDPSPDVVGGTGRIGGRAGTQADALEIDVAETAVTGDVAIAGNLTVTGTMPADKLLTSGVRTAQATTNVALDAAYDEYVLEIGYLAPSTGLTVEVLLAFDVGGTMKVGVDDYAWSYWERGPTSGTSSGADNSDDSMVIMAFAAAPTTPAGTPSTIQIRISSATGKESGISGVALIADDGTTYGQKRYEFVGMTRAKNYGKATFVQIKASTGTLSFTYALKGLAGS